MNINILKHKINQNAKLKKAIHYLIMDQIGSCPRKWVKWFINPFVLKYGKASIIKRSAIMNVSPINPFSIGKNSIIEHFSVLDNGVGKIEIGDYSRVGINNTIIGPVEIGNNTILAQNVVLSGLNHKYTDISLPIKAQGIETNTIIIEDEVWIGANSIIMAGVRIGKHSVVAGGSVVTKSVPPYTVVGGNPAHILKQYNPNTKKWQKITQKHEEN